MWLFFKLWLDLLSVVDTSYSSFPTRGLFAQAGAFSSTLSLQIWIFWPVWSFICYMEWELDTSDIPLIEVVDIF